MDGVVGTAVVRVGVCAVSEDDVEVGVPGTADGVLGGLVGVPGVWGPDGVPAAACAAWVLMGGGR